MNNKIMNKKKENKTYNFFLFLLFKRKKAYYSFINLMAFIISITQHKYTHTHTEQVINILKNIYLFITNIFFFF